MTLKCFRLVFFGVLPLIQYFVSRNWYGIVTGGEATVTVFKPKLTYYLMIVGLNCLVKSVVAY